MLRYPVSTIPTFFFPAGSLIEIGGWSEAESDLYEQLVGDLLKHVELGYPGIWWGADRQQIGRDYPVGSAGT